jgi:hypothetical protein
LKVFCRVSVTVTYLNGGLVLGKVTDVDPYVSEAQLMEAFRPYM